MRVVITGAGGFIGKTLVRALLQRGHLQNGRGETQDISEILLVDTHLLDVTDSRLTLLRADMASPDVLRKVADWKPDSIFHLAAVLTSVAEQNPAVALAVNVSALAALVEAVGDRAKPPKIVFPSSLAVFGGQMAEAVDDDHVQRPQTTYGTHKAIAELMLADATRHGAIDARMLRLPIVLVHPGPPTGSVSDRIAALVRDLAAGQPATCPVARITTAPVVSVVTAVKSLIAMHDIDAALLGDARAINQPALTVSMDQIIAATARSVGPAAAGHVTIAADAELERIVSGWPKRFVSQRAGAIGVAPDINFEDIVAHYLKSRDA